LILIVTSAWADQHKEPAYDYPSDVASVCFDTLYDLVKVDATVPPPAARIYGVAAVALYEAVMPDTLLNRSLVGQLNGLVSVPQPKKNGKYHWPTVTNVALAQAIRGLFPGASPDSLDAISAWEQTPEIYEVLKCRWNDSKGGKLVSTHTKSGDQSGNPG